MDDNRKMVGKMEVPAESRSGVEQTGSCVVPHPPKPHFDKLYIEINLK